MTTTTPSPYGSLAFHSLSSVVCGGGSDDYCSVVADMSIQCSAGDADERKIVVNSFAAASKRRVCCIRQDIKFQQRSRYRRFIGVDAPQHKKCRHDVSFLGFHFLPLYRAFSRFSQPRGRSY
jgi:hypothetical protein